jgi:LPS-assembly protein
MHSFREARSRIAKSSLLGGAALAFLFAASASAQTAFDLPTLVPGSAAPVLQEDVPEAAPATPPPPAPGDDALGQHGFYLEADTLVRNDKANIWIARGEVEARYQGRTLRGDEIIYNVTNGSVTVNGHGQIIAVDGSTEFGDHILLDDKMRAGFARGFAAHEAQNTTIAADVAIRRSDTVNELRRAIYTPCNVCAEDGSPKAPTWSIQASKIIEDHDRHLILYRNAVIRVKDIPVFYAPVFWHPDPSSPRASGLLAPLAAFSGKRGFSYEQPYLQIISPSAELFVSPQVNTKVNPLLNLEWRQRFYSGEMDIRAGYTYEKDFDGKGNKFGSLTSRSYVLGFGDFDLSKNWSWGFSAERTSDPLLFEKYTVGNVYDQRGLYSGDTQRLISQIYTTRQDTNSYLSVALISFQGLRQTPIPAGLTAQQIQANSFTEDNKVIPLVAPLIEFRYDPEIEIAGGRLHFIGNAVALSRAEQPAEANTVSPVLVAAGTQVNPTIVPGPDSRRASGEVNWLRTFTLSNGIRLEPFADLRGDVYNVSNLTATDRGDQTLVRGIGTLGLDATWPFIRQSHGTTIVLEPIAQLALSPNVALSPKVPNEDSAVFQYDETSLFEADKFPGYDLFDSGQRLNVGGRATINWGDDGQTVRFLVGQTFRAAPVNIFPVETGLNNTASDWVVSADVTPFKGLSFVGRMLIDDRGQSPLAEFGVNYASERFSGFFRYQTNSTNQSSTNPNLTFTDAEGGAQFWVTKHWGIGGFGDYDLKADAWRFRNLNVTYKDECIRVDVIYQHQDTIQGQLGASDTVLLRLTLATLGNEGYRSVDSR